MPYANSTRVENHIADVVNAQGGVWGGAIIDGRFGSTIDAIRQARIESGMEILRAISRNPMHGYYGSYTVLITVAHNAFLPDHDGEPGIPIIVPYAGAAAREGRPKSPDKIDSYRNDSASSPAYTGSASGAAVGHDQGYMGRPSPVSCFYSIVNQRFKFTGYSAQIPLVQLTRTMADASVPESYEPTLVKLAIPKLVKEGSNLSLYAGEYRALGQEDLVQIEGGVLKVRAVPNVAASQKYAL
jgi:hypothetical protein